ncbi:MAG: hypothetical protein K2V38_15690, partial [Gemmataceae bacterium]|nr:hypothetical protein [Gemmataceae bacterium]
MTTSQVTVKALAAMALVAGVAASAHAQPAVTPVTAEWAVKQQPRHPEVTVANPPAGACKVTPIPNDKAPGKTLGAVVTGPDGKPVRQFVSYDDKQFNIVVYFADGGVEAFREVYP